jgi:hypothetical protein
MAHKVEFNNLGEVPGDDGPQHLPNLIHLGHMAYTYIERHKHFIPQDFREDSWDITSDYLNKLQACASKHDLENNEVSFVLSAFLSLAIVYKAMLKANPALEAFVPTTFSVSSEERELTPEEIGNLVKRQVVKSLSK